MSAAAHMNRDSERDERSYIVRTWRERDALGALRWRGRIDDLASGERRYVTNFGDLCEFLAVAREGLEQR